MKYTYSVVTRYFVNEPISCEITVHSIVFSDKVMYATLDRDNGLMVQSTGFGIDPVDWKSISAIFYRGVKEAFDLLGMD